MVLVMLTTLGVCTLLALLALVTFLFGLYDRPQVKAGPLLPGILAQQKATGDPRGGSQELNHPNDEENTTQNNDKQNPVVFALVATTHQSATLKLENKLAQAAKGVLLNVMTNGDDGNENKNNENKQDSEQGTRISSKTGPQILQDGALAYLDPAQERAVPDELSVAFFYNRTTETPASVEKEEMHPSSQQTEAVEPPISPPPKWAIGWLCRDDDIDWEALQALIQDETTLQQVGLRLTPEQEAQQNKPTLIKTVKKWIFFWKRPAKILPPEELRLIRLEPVDLQVLRGSFPWRTFMTPTIAASMHWPRTIADFVSGKHGPATNANNSNKDNNNTPIAMEVYIRNRPRFITPSRVDFNLVLGQNESVWEDSHPGFSKVAKSTCSVTPSIRQKLEQEDDDEANDIVIEA